MNDYSERYLFSKYNDLLYGVVDGYFGFECGQGWLGIIDGTLSFLKDRHRNEGEGLKVVTVKEKFGRLRIYLRSGDQTDHDALDIAECVSGYMCECCGNQAGIVKIKGWLTVRCERCIKHETFCESRMPDSTYGSAYAGALSVIVSNFKEEAVRWVKTPARYFNDAKPCEVLSSTEGCQEVMLLISRLEHGVHV